MASHGMAADGPPLREGQLRLEQIREFPHHVVVHAVVGRPGRLGGVEIEACSQAEVPLAVGIGGDGVAARAGVGGHQGQPKLGSQAQGTGLLHEGLVRAGQAREPVESRDRAARACLGRQVHRKLHRAIQHPGAMAIATVNTAKTQVFAEQVEHHPQASKWITERMLLP